VLPALFGPRVATGSRAQGADSLFLVFLLRGDRWLIDQVFDFSES
jgi:hypothetical protein